MQTGKRTKSAASPSNKKRDTVSILTWIRDAKRDLHDSNMQLDISDESMDKWNVLFKADMFASHSSDVAAFEVMGDHGWIALSPNINEIFSNLLNTTSTVDKVTCYQVGGAMYEASLENGNLVQKNLATDVKRPVRKADDALYNDILECFKMHGNGRTPGVHLKMTFPPNFPHSPPFVRVVYPRFQFHTGHVTIGGSFCTEVLTMQSWDPQTTPIALLLYLKQNILEGGGRIDIDKPYEYSEKEAEEAFKRVARDHGWKI
jgi:hypothetical protein